MPWLRIEDPETVSRATRNVPARAPRLVTSALPLLLALASMAGASAAQPPPAAEDVSSGRFARQLEATARQVDDYFATPPEVPVPADAGGGYTHEQHKKNGIAIHDAGRLYALTGERRHATYAKELLLRYADLYPGLGEHPQKKEQTPGRLFWQSLNEAVWLVYAIQGYEAIAATLTAAEREDIVSGLLRPMAEFLSAGQPETFDRIHNHGTWAVAAVGMAGYALDEPDWVNQALYGLAGDGSAGFIKQLDLLFSPDGYYTEGPYYQRYALMPFVLFARAIEARQPEMAIFDYRDQVLLKAIRACIDLSYAGLFFPINDAIKDKGLDTVELRHGVAIAYNLTADHRLLSIAARQSGYVLSAAGQRVAEALDLGLAEPWEFQSRLLRDGPDGADGALAVLRNVADGDHQAVLLKAVSQGLGHGHFDRLNWLFYDRGGEIVADYGAARFLNIPQKNGGHYLAENASYAKQSIAHNTLVVDGRSHFDGDWQRGERHHPRMLYFGGDDKVQVAAAEMTGAYEGVRFSRAIALLKLHDDAPPMVFDRLRVMAEGSHRYDHPLHFRGQYIAASPDLRHESQGLSPLGTANGYQHLWRLGSLGLEPGTPFSLTWLKNGRFYTYHALVEGPTEALMALTGANDPQRNLRHEQALILRVENASQHTFAALLEPHGEYNGAEEYTVGSSPTVRRLERFAGAGAELYRITLADGRTRHLGLATGDHDPAIEHRVTVAGREYVWQGYHAPFAD